MATSFSGGGSWSTRRELPTLGKQLVNFVTCGCESSDVAYVVGVNFGNVKSSRILTFFDASRRYFVSITFTAYVSEYSSYQWLPEGKNNKIVYTF